MKKGMLVTAIASFGLVMLLGTSSAWAQCCGDTDPDQAGIQNNCSGVDPTQGQITSSGCFEDGNGDCVGGGLSSAGNGGCVCVGGNCVTFGETNPPAPAPNDTACAKAASDGCAFNIANDLSSLPLP